MEQGKLISFAAL